MASSRSPACVGQVGTRKVVTSPPFLEVVDYAENNWLRCWFAGIDPQSVKLMFPRKLDAWATALTGVLREPHRVSKPGGHVTFEVGEVPGGKTKLEETMLPCGVAAGPGLVLVLVLINDQEFTKTANGWGGEEQQQRHEHESRGSVEEDAACFTGAGCDPRCARGSHNAVSWFSAHA
jgi:hypothetical protein